MRNRTRVSLALLASALLASLATAEVVHLTNGDVVHGTLVAANNDEVTLKTPYGQLVIPKEEIARIDYSGGAAPAAAAEAKAPAEPPDELPAPTGERGRLVLHITGRSFWYAFDSPPDRPADTSIRLRLYVGSARACTFVDEKPDTVDGSTLYNSFTFSPTDSRLLETLEGFECSVTKSDDGEVTLAVGLPPDFSTGRQLVRMVYEVNEGDPSLPRWLDVVSRSFSVEVAPGKVASVILEQHAEALEYSGFFKKQMKNLDQFQLAVLSTELQS